jgi:hypothetical protein
MDVIIHICGRLIGDLYEIGSHGWASSGYSQDEQFCITKAIEEFIEKYKKGSKGC